MVERVLVQLVDDLDGRSGEDVSTVQFGLDGITYEIDLAEVNAERLRESLAGYVDSARRVGGRMRRGASKSSPTQPGGSEAGRIREWASANGYEVSSRGRMPSHIVDAYHESRTKTSRPERTNGSKTKRTRAARH